MARVLLLSDTEALGILWCASAGGHQVIVAGVPSRNPTVSINPRCHKFVPLPESCSYTDESQFDDLAERLAGVAQSFGVDILSPSSFESLKFVVAQRERLSRAARLIPLASLETLRLLDDKHSFYQFCRKHGFPHPASCLMESAAALEKPEFLALEFPLLTKPVLGAAEEGIERFETRAALEERLSRADAGFFPVLAQEWFEGEDIDFNGYALDGETPVSSVMRTTRYGSGRSEVRLTEFVKHPEVSRIGLELVRASGFTGPLNVDLRIRESDKKVLLIEVNPRFWGRSMACLIDGLNFVDAAIQLTDNPGWRKVSRCDGSHWASSIVPLLKGAATGDRVARRHLAKLSRVQLAFQAHTRTLALVAKLRGRASSPSGVPART